MSKLTTTEIYGNLTVHGSIVSDSNGLKIRDTANTYYLSLVSDSTPNLAANRNLTIDVGNANRNLGLYVDLYVGTALNTGSITISSDSSTARNITIAGNITTAGALTTASSFTTSGAYALTLTTTAITSLTLPSGTDTVLGVAAVQSITGAKTFDNSTIKIKGSSTGITTLTSANASANNYTLTLPAFTGNMAVTTSNSGSIIVPYGTTANRDETPLSGYFRYNTDTGKFEGYKASSWGSVGGGATGGGSDEIFIENGQNVTTNYTITAGKNAGTFGPVTINDGTTVTIPDGSVWTLV